MLSVFHPLSFILHPSLLDPPMSDAAKEIARLREEIRRHDYKYYVEAARN